MNELKQHYLENLPDKPRWVETRDLLAWKGSSIIEGKNGDGFVVWSEDDDIGSVVGDVESAAILRAANACSELLAFSENIHVVQRQLAGFQAEQATIFEAPDSFPTSPAHLCQPLSVSDIASMKHVPENLQDELLDLENDALLVAALDGDLPVAFAYVASETETLWDVSIDTLETHRRRGYAASAVYALMNIMKNKGKTAVWGALQSNPASSNLACKLGFVEVDELWVLTRSDAS